MAFIEDLPEAYYRVSIKALVFDGEGRLLVSKDRYGNWEIPGGGWEKGESLEACISRELAEEVQVSVASVGELAFCYRGTTKSGNPKLCLVVRVTLNDSRHLVPSGDDLVEARYVSEDEFLMLPLQKDEEGVRSVVDKIWPPKGE